MQSRLASLLACFAFLSAEAVVAGPPRNVIFLIGDGMGFGHVQAGGMYLNGSAGTLCFESLPYQAQVRTYSANSSITDSAAAATALATGIKVNNGVIAMAYPGDGRELQSLLEFYKARGASIGLVTSDAMTGATPAGFGAHESDRNNSSQIAGDYLNRSRPNILLGGGGVGMTTSAAIAAGYAVVTDSVGMLTVDTNLVTLLSGQFGSGSMPYEYVGLGSLPHLSQMAATALDVLDNDPDGFFLLVEGGNIDHAAHDNILVRDVHEVVEFNNAVQVALDWADGRTDTLVIVTADHETGGLSIVQNNGKGNLPTVSWSTGGHTGVNVGAWATGYNAEYVTGILDNTQFFRIITAAEPAIILSVASLTKWIAWGHDLPANVDTFTVRNTGMGALEYMIDTDAAWVHAEPAGGTCTTETDTIGLVYDTASLGVGEHVAHLTVADSEASNSPQTITVTLIVGSVPPDFDDDLDVDQEDYGVLQACLTSGAGGSLPAGCGRADFDGDGSVGQVDITIFLGCFGGPNVPVDPNCAD